MMEAENKYIEITSHDSYHMHTIPLNTIELHMRARSLAHISHCSGIILICSYQSERPRSSVNVAHMTKRKMALIASVLYDEKNKARQMGSIAAAAAVAEAVTGTSDVSMGNE